MKAARLAVAIVLLASGCTSSPTPTAHAQPSPTATVHTYAGGCAGTMVTDAIPPVWAQGGWTNPGGQPWWVPWAFGTSKTTVAYLFATQLVAGTSPRVDGSNNKVLWEAKDHPSGGGVTVVGHPLGQSQPIVTIAGGPSITDVPTAGCWTFVLTWGPNAQQNSTINLQVLPAGTNPMTLPKPAGA